MKTQFQQAGKWLVLFPLWVLLLQHTSASAQTTCATATSITDSYYNSSLSASDSVRWYQFTATRTDGEIQLLVDAPSYTSIKLYSGTCAGLTLRDTSRVESFGYVLDYTSLTISSTYYIKLTKSGTSSVSFGLGFILNPFSLNCTTCYNSGCELVCNGSMENCSANPWGFSQINQIYCWGNPAGTEVGSPDQYNSSGTNGFDVPTNNAGTESAHTGSSYAGVILYGATAYAPPCPSSREFVVGKLGSTLTAGCKYRVSFWVSLADNSGWAVGKIGAYISSTVPTQTCYGPMPSLTPQILETNIISQDNGWVQITGTFTASGGEQYITIGTFVTNSNLPKTTHTPAATAPLNGYAYYYIDDVSIVPEPDITVTQQPVGACINMPVTLTASVTGGSVQTYSWSPSQGTMNCVTTPPCDQATFANTFTSTTTYTVSSTLFAGCTVTNTFTFGPAASGLTVNAGADLTMCTGGTTTLTGTATGTYNTTSWKILNSSTLCTGCTTVTITPPNGTTSYVYTVSNSTTGCIKSDTINVTTVPLTVNIVSPAGATTCAGCFNFTTTQAYSTYSWSTNAVTSSGGSTSTLNACWGAPYDTSGLNGNVSVSVVDASGCTGSGYLIVPSCCPYKDGQETAFPNLINDSTTRVDNVTYPTLFWYNTANQYYEAGLKNFSINGTFIVDRNTRLKGCDIKLGPNAKIIIRPGVKLELTDTANTKTTLHACSDMWDGIYVDGTNSQTKFTMLNGSVIEDAKNAVVSTNGGNFFIDGGTGTCKFNKNNIGILIKAYTGAHPGVVRKTILACDAPGQPGSTTGITFAGTNCRAPVSGIGFAGIYIENCTNVTVGDSTQNVHRNLFERTQYGIYATLSNVYVWNNDFKYFTTTVVGKNLPANGIAVYATATKQNPKTLTVGRQGNYKAKNKFQKCSNGVLTYNYMNLNCEFNRFDSCMSKGIYALNCISRTILINKDTLNECTGTNISVVQANNSTVTITYNSLNQTQSNSAANFGQTGIYVANSVIVKVNLKIQNNSVKKMRNGIWVTRVKGGQITDNNPITFIPSTSYTMNAPARGITIQECNNSLVRNNTIGYNGTLTSTDYHKIYGVYVQDCHNDTVCKNALTKMGSGIFLKNNDKPSVIACNSMDQCKIGINFGYVNSIYNPVALDSQLVWVSTNTPTGNTWTGMGTNPCLQGRIIGAASGIAWYHNTNTNATPTNNVMFLGSFTNGNAVTSLGSTSNQCSAMITPPALSAAERRDRMLGNIVKTPSTYDTLNAEFRYAENVYAYRQLRENPSWKSLGTSNDSYYNNFYNTESSTNIGKFADVEDSLSAGQVAGASTLLASITPSGQYETNRKSLLGVYIQTWAVDTMNFTTAQEATLLSIANQHPLTGGSSVYDARVMLNYEVNDSSSLRIAPEPEVSTMPSTQVGKIYPNPTTGQVSIEANLTEEETGTMELYDLMGRKVASWTMVGGQALYTFDVSGLPQGTYIYQISSGAAILASERLIIVKE